jgi:flavin reductase (DIM6/NTAB) family NADH-FMN oxidoreductase RutF
MEVNMSDFKDLRIVDNFYQTSAFFPMPTILVGTLSETGETNLGAYSLCFPYYVAGKEYYAMILECRNNSNTAQNILRGSKVSLNFIPDNPKYFREAVRLGFPGETTAEKMKRCLFTLETGLAEGVRPKAIKEAFQVFECSWDGSLENAAQDRAGCTEGYPPPYRNFNGITSKFGAHFILKIDKILMKEKYYQSIIGGVKAKDFPALPVDYGYRDSTNFWYSPFKKPKPEKVQAKEGDLQSVKYAASRIDPAVKFTDEACAKLTKIPRIFLKAALTQMVSIAKEEGISIIDEPALALINDKRRAEKKR